MQSELDWWVASVDKTTGVRTGAYSAFLTAGLKKRDTANDWSSTFGIPTLPAPGCWTADNTLIFAASLGDSQNLWQTRISGNKVTGDFKRVTTGGGYESFPACAANTLVFANSETKRGVWLVPMDLDHGRATGSPQLISSTPAFREYPSLSGDGTRILFTSTQSGRMNNWLIDRRMGKETQVNESSLVQRFGILHRSGTKTAFSVYEPNAKRSLYLSDFSSPPQKICEGCLRATDWSRDDTAILTFGDDPYRISRLELSSLRRQIIIERKPWPVLYGRFSPDNSWVSFTVRVAPNRSRIMIAPVQRRWPVPEEDWIEISEETAEDWANWSPDGKKLYFTSARDGHICFWGQRIDPVTHHQFGKPFGALHLHGRLSYLPDNGWSLSTNSLAVVADDDTGAVWMMSRAHKP